MVTRIWRTFPPYSAQRTAALLTAVTLSLASCSPAGPDRGWECLAPANAGGGWDLTCRAVGRVLEDMEIAPGPVRTTNLPGAGGGVAFARTVAQRRDDPNLLVAASPSTVLRLAQRQYGGLAETDVRWVGAVGAEYGVLAVAADAPWQGLGDLIATLREDPGAVIVSGGSAVAGQDHMKVLLLAQRAGVDPLRIRYVPFDGGGEAMTALLGGFVHLFAGEASEIEAQVEAGRLRPLAVLAPERLGGLMADVPTALESVIDLTVLTIGGGWHTAIAPNTDFFAALGFADGEVDISGFGSEDDSGYSLEAGIRSMMSNELELYGSISQVDFDGFGDGTQLNAGLWYTVSGNLALGLGASFEDDITSYGIGIRLYFDR